MRSVTMMGALLIGAGAVWAQATVPQVYVPVALPGDATRKTATVVVLPPLTLSRDASGTAQLGVMFSVSPPPTPGSGLLIEAVPNTTTSRIAIDKLQVLYRALPPYTPVPAIGSPCSGDAGVIVDRAYLYVCVPPLETADPATNPTWTWAGAALQLVATPSPVAKK